MPGFYALIGVTSPQSSLTRIAIALVDLPTNSQGRGGRNGQISGFSVKSHNPLA
jgi:hypothetical protein